MTKLATRIVGSFLVILSGLILFLDKIFYFDLQNNFGFSDSQTFIWVFTQSVSPLILILATQLKPYKISFTIPIYMYFIQLYWVFDSSLKADDLLLHIYALGACALFIISSIIVNQLLKLHKQEDADKLSLLEEMLDLSITIRNKKSNEL